jgi:hypothetical protein
MFKVVCLELSAKDIVFNAELHWIVGLLFDSLVEGGDDWL